MHVYLDGEGPSNVRYKVDLPPDTTHHVIRYRLDMTALEYLLITHAHPDHLDTTFLQVRRQAISGREALRELQVYGSEEVEERIRGAVLDLSLNK
jgi:ribonuclease BN (tRNA processing enzyme)